MIKVQGYLYDGQTSKREKAEVCFFESGEIILKRNGYEIRCAKSTIRITPRIADVPCSVYFSNGAKFEALHNEVLDAAVAYFQQGIWHHVVHKLENHWIYLCLALLGTLCLIWLGIEHGIPYAAKLAAQRIPLSVEQRTGAQSLQTLDRLLLQPSTLNQTFKQRLHRRFNDMTGLLSKQGHYRLLFRNSPQLGANAFVLPGNIVILTDDLVKLSENDEQLIAVMAHELGHIEHRHVMRTFFQNSTFALLLASVLGDVNSISSFAVTIPTFLVKTRYSREFEMEADRYALQMLDLLNIPQEQFALILLRMQDQTHSKYATGFLSTHPSTRQRIATIRSE